MATRLDCVVVVGRLGRLVGGRAGLNRAGTSPAGCRAARRRGVPVASLGLTQASPRRL